MTETTTTLIYPLRHDPRSSARVGYLCSQERLAYNFARNVLNRTPDVPLYSGKRGTGLLPMTSAWRRKDGRADAHRSIHMSGACRAWIDNELMMRERNDSLLNVEWSHAVSSGLKRHRRRLRPLSRKHGTSTLSCLIPPVRVDESAFAIPGAGDVILRTKRPVPEGLDIRSFRVVEVRRQRRGVNGGLDRRRYALHLQVALKRPEPQAHEAVAAPDEILGLDDADMSLLVANDGEAIGPERLQTRPSERRAKASRKKMGSKRRAKLLRQARRLAQKTRASRRTLIRQGAARLLDLARPKAVALGSKRFDRRGIRRYRTKAVDSSKETASAEAIRSVGDAALSERSRIVAEEAAKRGIRVYNVLPQMPSRDGRRSCGGCGRRRREGSESQATFRCRGCGYEADASANASRVLRNRAFLIACLASGRELVIERAPTGWRVRPSRDARDMSNAPQGVDKPKGDEERQATTLPHARGDYLRGASHKAGSPEQDAQRQLMDDPINKHAITFLTKLPVETVAILQRMVHEDAADSTKRWYISAMANWAEWAIANGCPLLPARTPHLALYFVLRAREGYRPRSLKSYATAISAYHRMLGLGQPVTPRLRNLLRGLMNKYGDTLTQTPGLREKHLRALRKSAVRPRQGRSPAEAERMHRADIALISLMRDALLRRNEAAALLWNDIEEAPDGAGLVTIRRSKSDPFGEGAVLYLSRETMTDLNAIRDGAGPDGSVFGLSGDMIHDHIRQVMKAAGLGGSFGGHSPRRGMAQDLLNSGASAEELMEAGRWKTIEMALDYATGGPPELRAAARYQRRKSGSSDAKQEWRWNDATRN